jgi:molybdopterin molybdotransferase
MAEIVLLKNVSNNWMPLATGNLSLDAVAQADAWRLVSDESEGFAARAPLDAYMLRDCL